MIKVKSKNGASSPVVTRETRPVRSANRQSLPSNDGEMKLDIKLPADVHAEFKEKCKYQKLSMARVVRALIENWDGKISFSVD